MFNLLTFLNRFTDVQLQAETQRLARAAVQCCLPAAGRLTGQRLAVFTFPTARGYVRAKVGGLLRGELNRLSATIDPALPDLREPALDQAVESLTQLLLGNLLKQQRTGGLRMAA
jgi:hypothetical protein